MYDHITAMNRSSSILPSRLPASPIPSKRSSTTQEPITNKRLSHRAPNASSTVPSYNTWQPPEAGITIPENVYSELRRLIHVPKETLALYMGVMFRLEEDTHPSWQYDSSYSQRSSISSTCWTRASMTSIPSSTTSDGSQRMIHDLDSPRNSDVLSKISEQTQITGNSQSGQQASNKTNNQKSHPGSHTYFCTYSCSSKGFVKRSDWKSHETQYHDPQVEFTCTLCNIPTSFRLEKRFTQHHGSNHGCKPCHHAAHCKHTLPIKRAWGCGFCGQCLTTWDARAKHVAAHFEAGINVSAWEHRLVMRGLLRQPAVVKEWLEVLNKTFGTPDCWPQLDWVEDTTSELQAGLQLGGNQSPEALAIEAIRLAISIEDRMNLTIGIPPESRILRSQGDQSVSTPAYNDAANDDNDGVEFDHETHKSPIIKIGNRNRMNLDEVDSKTIHPAQSTMRSDVSTLSKNPTSHGSVREVEANGVFYGSFEDFLNLHAANYIPDDTAIDLDNGITTEDVDLINAWTADLPIQPHAAINDDHSLGDQHFLSHIQPNLSSTIYNKTLVTNSDIFPVNESLLKDVPATEPTSPRTEALSTARPKTPLGRFVKRLKQYP